MTIPFCPPRPLAALLAPLVLAFVLALGPAAPSHAQERLESSALAGVPFPEPSWGWTDDPEGAKAAAIEAAAAEVGRSCGATEFHVWQTADDAIARGLHESVDAALRSSGWALDAMAAEPGGRGVVVASKETRALVLDWVRLPEQEALALFLCEARPAGAPPAAAPTVSPADEDDVDPVSFVLGIGLALGATGFGLVWNTASHRRRAGAASGWPVVTANVLSSDVAVETDTDADGGTKTSYVPRLRYRYVLDRRTYEGNRIRFGATRFPTKAAADALVRRYPAGGTADLRYDPGNPAEAVIETDKPSTWKIVFGMVFLLIAAFLLMTATAIWQGV